MPGDFLAQFTLAPFAPAPPRIHAGVPSPTSAPQRAPQHAPSPLPP